MENNGKVEAINKRIEELREMKHSFLARRNEMEKQDMNWWTRQFDKEIRKLLKERDQFMQ